MKKLYFATLMLFIFLLFNSFCFAQQRGCDGLPKGHTVTISIIRASDGVSIVTDVATIERAMTQDSSYVYNFTGEVPGVRYIVDCIDNTDNAYSFSFALESGDTYIDYSLSAIKTAVNGILITVGAGDTVIDENTGGTDHLRYVYNSQGIDNADIKIYLKSDYDAGNRSNSYIKAQSRTKVDGRWQWPVYLDSGFTYTVVFYKQGVYHTSTVEITI